MPLIFIDTLEDTRLDAYARLTEAQLRNKLEPEKGIFIAESGKVIERAYRAGMQAQSLLMEEKWLEPLQPLVDSMLQSNPQLPVFIAPHKQLEQLTGFELTRGALAAFKRPPLRPVSQVIQNARRIAVLENITNHTNVGAIFRSAAALNIDAVLVTPECYDPLYRRAVRVSMGTVFQVPWTVISNSNLEETVEEEAGEAPFAAAENKGGASSYNNSACGNNANTNVNTNSYDSNNASCNPAAYGAHTAPQSAKDAHTLQKSSWSVQGIPYLHQQGFATAALALTNNSISLDDPQLKNCEKLALILGTEGDGLAPETIERCTYTVRIPMAHGVDSLNVAAASAVAFWELRCR